MGITITKQKTLRMQLKEMKIGSERLVRYSQFSPIFVRRVVKSLNDSGFHFEATERDIIGGIKVTRTN